MTTEQFPIPRPRPRPPSATARGEERRAMAARDGRASGAAAFHALARDTPPPPPLAAAGAETAAGEAPGLPRCFLLSPAWQIAARLGSGSHLRLPFPGQLPPPPHPGHGPAESCALARRGSPAPLLLPPPQAPEGLGATGGARAAAKKVRAGGGDSCTLGMRSRGGGPVEPPGRIPPPPPPHLSVLGKRGRALPPPPAPLSG